MRLSTVQQGTSLRPVSRRSSTALTFCLLTLLSTVACSRTGPEPDDSDAVSACRDRLSATDRDGSRTTVGTAADGSWRVRIWTGPGSGTVGPPGYECRVVAKGHQVVVTAFHEYRK